MSTANTTPHAAVQNLIEQRLDSIDQALLGVLPRHDRLALVAQVETRIRELAAASAVNLPVPAQLSTDPASAGPNPPATIPLVTPHLQAFGPASGGWFHATRTRKSRLAVTAGVLGIVALGLLLATPVTYFIVATIGELLGEFISYALLAAHVVSVTIGGMAAVALGFAALVSLHRRKGQLVGHGWAIAGLCTGPVPMLLGCAAMLFIGSQLGFEEFFTTSVPQVASDAFSPPRSESSEEIGSSAMPVPPARAEESQPDFSRSPVQPVGHEAPAVTTRLPWEDNDNEATQPAGSSNPRKPKAQPQSGPATAPQPDPPDEPVSMPESAPGIR